MISQEILINNQQREGWLIGGSKKEQEIWITGTKHGTLQFPWGLQRQILNYVLHVLKMFELPYLPANLKNLHGFKPSVIIRKTASMLNVDAW